MSYIALCSEPFEIVGSNFVCNAELTQTIFIAPVSYTPEMVMEALFQGFIFGLPVLAVVFGGRQILKMLR
jgi:hypothetical protein